MASQGETKAAQPLSRTELELIDAWWRAANYLSVGQIYLLDNPLLEHPLELADIKPRLLGHWGTTPGLNFVYAHLNRVIKARDLDVIYICGPGHGGPGMVANTWLEGTYSELYPNIAPDKDGMRRLFRQFSFPGGIPSHAAPETPGSINEGGELGYSLSHAYGAAFDNPGLLVACVIGDGEAETGPLAAAWHGNKFLSPATDGAVLPILHLNGYKIANPTILARIPHEELEALLLGYGYKPHFVEGDDPPVMHQLMAATLDRVLDEIAALQKAARAGATPVCPQWPMIVLRSPKGWTGPKTVDGLKTEGYWRAHQVPIPDMSKPEHVKLLEGWMTSYRPRRIVRRRRPAEARDRGPGAFRRPADERQPARQWRLAAARARDARFHQLRDPGHPARPGRRRGDAGHGRLSARHHQSRTPNFRLFGPDETASNRLSRGVRGHRPPMGGRDPARGRPFGARRARSWKF